MKELDMIKNKEYFVEGTIFNPCVFIGNLNNKMGINIKEPLLFFNNEKLLFITDISKVQEILPKPYVTTTHGYILVDNDAEIDSKDMCDRMFNRATDGDIYSTIEDAKGNRVHGELIKQVHITATVIN